MNLEQIQEMWEKDSQIDPDNLHDESLKIPQLHAKYYTLYNTVTLLREKARETHNRIKLERYNYYTGKANPEVYGFIRPIGINFDFVDLGIFGVEDDGILGIIRNLFRLVFYP